MLLSSMIFKLQAFWLLSCAWGRCVVRKTPRALSRSVAVGSNKPKSLAFAYNLPRFLSCQLQPAIMLIPRHLLVLNAAVRSLTSIHTAVDLTISFCRSTSGTISAEQWTLQLSIHEYDKVINWLWLIFFNFRFLCQGQCQFSFNIYYKFSIYLHFISTLNVQTFEHLSHFILGLSFPTLLYSNFQFGYQIK